MKTIVAMCAVSVMLFSASVCVRGQNQQVDKRDSGSSLYQACKAEIRFMGSSDDNNESDRTDSFRCIGYLQGFMDAYSQVQPQQFCAANATLGKIALVYVNYMHKNPKLMDTYRGTGVYHALKDAYPCPK